MRLFEFDIAKKNPALKQISDLINRDCQPFLREIRFPNNSNRWLYRGVADFQADRRMEPIQVRTDRRPKDSAVAVHNITDQWMLEQFGWKPRSQGLFVCGNVGLAGYYGKVCAVFPRGEFQYVWSPVINDLTAWIGNAIGTVPKSEEELRDYNSMIQKIIELLEAGKWQQNKGMLKCLQNTPGHEITIKCGSYYAVPVTSTYFEDLPEYLKGQQ